MANVSRSLPVAERQESQPNSGHAHSGRSPGPSRVCACHFHAAPSLGRCKWPASQQVYFYNWNRIGLFSETYLRPTDLRLAAADKKNLSRASRSIAEELLKPIQETGGDNLLPLQSDNKALSTDLDLTRAKSSLAPSTLSPVALGCTLAETRPPTADSHDVSPRRGKPRAGSW